MEERNQNTLDIDELTTYEIIKKINEEDKKIADAIEKELPQIETVIDQVAAGFKNGGRLFYIGSGTSGKVGILDASECPPTFGVEDELVQGILSGGYEAIGGWLESCAYDPKTAILSIKLGTDAFTAKKLLQTHNGYVAEALKAGERME